MNHKKLLGYAMQALVISFVFLGTTHATSSFDAEFDLFLTQGKFQKSLNASSLQASQINTSYLQGSQIIDPNNPQEAQRRGICQAAVNLNQRWTLPNAVSFANLCLVYMRDNATSPKEKACLSYRGISALKVNFSDDEIDLEKRSRAGKNLADLLEILKTSLQNCPTKEELPFFDTPISYFHEEDIPQARVCALLSMVYGQPNAVVFEQENDKHHCNNLSSGLYTYSEALRGATTPCQRIHYHEMILLTGRKLQQNDYFLTNSGPMQLPNLQNILNQSVEILGLEKTYFNL